MKKKSLGVSPWGLFRVLSAWSFLIVELRN